MSSINGVISGVAVSTPNRDEGAAPGSISNWSLDWRQAFEQARQVEYGDWFGSGGPTVSQLPKPKVAPETANALLSASLRQSMKPDHSSSVEFRSPTVVSDAVPESHRGKARTPEAAERSHTPQANDAAIAQPGAAAPADGHIASSVAGADAATSIGIKARTTAAAPAGGSAGDALTTHPTASPATGHARSDDHAAQFDAPSDAAQATTPASAQALPSVAGVIDTLLPPIGNAELAISAAALSLIDSPGPAMRLVVPPPPAPVTPPSSTSAVNFAVVDEHERPGPTAEARPALRTAPTTADSGDDAPRVHAELSQDGLKIWLGIEIDESLPGELEGLLVQLHPMLAAHGQPLAELFCNGRSVWRASPRPSDAPVQRRLQSLDVFSPATHPTP